MTGELDSTTREALVELNEQFTDQEQQADQEQGKEAAWNFFEQHLSEQLAFRRANGQVVGKRAFLDGLTNNPFEYRRAVGITPSRLDDQILVTLVIEARRKDDKTDHRYRNIRLFSRTGDRWVVEFWYNYEIAGI